MSDISGQQLVMTLKTAVVGGLTFAASAAGLLWIVLELTIGSLSTNVSNLQSAITDFHKDLMSVQARSYESEGGLAADIADIRENVAILTKESVGVSDALQTQTDAIRRMGDGLVDVRERVIRIEERVGANSPN